MLELILVLFLNDICVFSSFSHFMKWLVQFFSHFMKNLKYLAISCNGKVNRSFHEMARIFSHFMKWLTSQIDCNIYTSLGPKYTSPGSIYTHHQALSRHHHINLYIRKVKMKISLILDFIYI